MLIRLIQISGSIFIGGLIVAGAISSKSINAATGDPTGSCGALLDINYRNIQTSAGMSHGSNALMLVNFDALTITARATVTSYESTPQFPTNSTKTIGPVKFSMAAGALPNTYVITPESGSGIPTFAAMSVNSGQTFLLQAQNDRGTGVCQKL
jgi:hypothetical protein